MALFLDFDGTLVEIADTPDRVIVSTLLKERLTAVSAFLEGAVAVVSGRRIADIDAMLDGGCPAVAGLHGWERRTIAGEVTYASPLPSLAAARAACAAFAAETEGVLLEDKGAGFALHYRLRPAAAEACWRAALAAAKTCPELEARGGHCVVELRPRHASKGHAVGAYLAEAPFAGRVPVFIGDDITDEDAFAVVRDAGGIAVLVGPHRDTQASAHLPTVADVHTWLTQPATHGANRITADA